VSGYLFFPGESLFLTCLYTTVKEALVALLEWAANYVIITNLGDYHDSMARASFGLKIQLDMAAVPVVVVAVVRSA
jgi:hypothetical protein